MVKKNGWWSEHWDEVMLGIAFVAVIILLLKGGGII